MKDFVASNDLKKGISQRYCFDFTSWFAYCGVGAESLYTEQIKNRGHTSLTWKTPKM